MKLLYVCLEMSSDSKNYFGCVVDGIFLRGHTMTLTLRKFFASPAVICSRKVQTNGFRVLDVRLEMSGYSKNHFGF